MGNAGEGGRPPAAARLAAALRTGGARPPEPRWAFVVRLAGRPAPPARPPPPAGGARGGAIGRPLGQPPAGDVPSRLEDGRLPAPRGALPLGAGVAAAVVAATPPPPPPPAIVESDRGDDAPLTAGPRSAAAAADAATAAATVAGASPRSARPSPAGSNTKRKRRASSRTFPSRPSST